jgi:rubrerythrin
MKEKQGLHLAKKKFMCPHCGSRIQVNDTICPSCQKALNTGGEKIVGT